MDLGTVFIALFMSCSLSVALLIFFLKMGFTPCKAEQSLQGMELQEKEQKN